MRLTIAIPTYRRPEMLRECVSALLLQLRDDVELVVIDNDPGASARALVGTLATARLRYAHEPKSGVVQARNRAVREAAGRYLAFIDDDEVARPDWVAALLRHVELGVSASFGRVIPRFLGGVEPGLERLLADLYTRDLRQPQDADISDLAAYTGTGNSMFDRHTCFPEPDPFSERFNGTGGEDVWLIRSLVDRGVALHWNPAAIVEELVPADRSTLAYARFRRFQQGQKRVVVARGDAGRGRLGKSLFWMGVGAAQYGAHGATALALKAAGQPKWRSHAVRASGGLGKLLWWKLWEQTPYAGAGPGADAAAPGQ